MRRYTEERAKNLCVLDGKKKNLPSTNGTGGNSRGTTQINHIRRLRLVIHFVPTIIGLPCNAGIAVQTTAISLGRLGRELQLVSAGCKFQQILLLSSGFHRSTFLCHCL